jgi:hypothetical protein
VIGAAAIPLIGYIVAPAWKALKSILPGRERAT